MNSQVLNWTYPLSMIWDPQKSEWYVAGIKYHTIDITPSGLSEFHQDFFIILNVAVGGNWPGSPDASTVFPQTMEVDYVRVYQDASALPEINIIEPADNTVFDPGSELVITAGVDFEGVIEKVEFYQGSVQIGETTVSPYQNEMGKHLSWLLSNKC